MPRASQQCGDLCCLVCMVEKQAVVFDQPTTAFHRSVNNSQLLLYHHRYLQVPLTANTLIGFWLSQGNIFHDAKSKKNETVNG